MKLSFWLSYSYVLSKPGVVIEDMEVEEANATNLH